MASFVLDSQVGKPVPPVKLFEGQADYGAPREVDLASLCAGKTVVIFALPGAFTPTCSKAHLPSYLTARQQLTEAGVDTVICTCTNDPYVMQAWGVQQGVGDSILMLSDKDAALCRALGVANEGGVMVRSQRYAMVVRDGVISAFLPAVKPTGEADSANTYAQAVLNVLAPAAAVAPAEACGCDA